MLSFVEDPPDATNGFKPNTSQARRFEEQNFWFRARNRLIQWRWTITFRMPEVLRGWLWNRILVLKA